MSAKAALLLLSFLPTLFAAAPVRAEDCAALWVPDGPVRAADVQAYLADPASRLSAALSPEQVDRSTGLVELASQGRLEFALRIPGDPLLPFISRGRPQDALARVALARARHRDAFGALPAGIVPGAGALTAELAGPLAAQGLRWAAVGDYLAAPADAWSRAAGLALVPVAQGTAAVRVSSELSALPSCGRTVAELAASASALAPAVPPTWLGPLAEIERSSATRAALELYAAAAAALGEYQNSGGASLNTLEKATGELYAAQEGRFFLPASAGASGPAFRGRVEKVFRTLGRSAPESLPAAELERSTVPVPSTRVRALREGNALVFENAPAPSAGLSADGTAREEHGPRAAPSTSTALWDLSRMRVEWDEGSVVFTVGMRALERSSAAPSGFDRLLLDVYLDINNRPRAGSTDLLPGRPGFLASEDGWEYALVFGGWSAALYRFIPGQGPVLVEKLRPQPDAALPEVRVSVPRARLRGNPAGWGYLPLALEADKAAATRTPPEPRPEGAYGIVAPTRLQERLRAGLSRSRKFPALRFVERAPSQGAGGPP
ncbi:MAG: glucodextranase DOMON-like domain-containing protein [Elusimicrobiota bacterium]|jgi:hypothetical protein